MTPDIHSDPTVTVASVAGRRRTRPLEGLLWCEWFAHSRLLLSFLVLWMLCVWAAPVFIHRYWLLLFGIGYALVAGPRYGGGDVIEGCEEFAFALPATRAERYLARLAVGGGALLVFTLLDLLALGFDLPELLAGLYVNTGLIRPSPVLKPGLLYGLVFAVPFAVFAFSFALAAATHSRSLVFTAWFWSALATLILLHLGLHYEDFTWNEMNGFFAFPVLIVAGVASLGIGLRVYARKEATPQAAPLALPAHWWLWALLFLVGLGLTAVLLGSLVRLYPRFFTGAG